MTNPQRRSVLALLVGFVSGVVVMGSAVLAAGAWLLVRGLPDDPMVVQAYRSSETSRLEAGDGRTVAEFPLVEAVEPLGADATLLVEAYLALHSGAFYEARVDRTLPLLPVVLGTLRGERLLASPLSRSVADALTAGTPRGTVRDLRADLLAARLDSTAELHVRTAAHLQTLPLCHGRRGIVEALRACLGVAEATIGPAEAALLAGAAAFELDLSDDLDLLEARAAAVLDRLTLQRRLDAEEATARLREAVARARDRRTADRSVGEDPLVVSLTEQTRRRFGMAAEPAGLVLRTTLRSETQAGMAAVPGLRGGVWAVVDPRTGTATALGGDLLSPLTLAEDSLLAGFLPEPGRGERAPTVSDLVGGLLGAVQSLDGRAEAGTIMPQRLQALTSVRVGERAYDAAEDGPRIRRFHASAEDAWMALDALPREGRLRVVREGRLLVLAHPGALGVLLGTDAGAVADLTLPATVLGPTAGDDEFGVPDGLWVAADGTVVRRGVLDQ